MQWMIANYESVLSITMIVLGAMVTALRILAPLTHNKKDDWFLGKLEWLADLMAKILVPGKYKAASLGGGKGGDGQA